MVAGCPAATTPGVTDVLADGTAGRCAVTVVSCSNRARRNG
jgi:hypothetical protein